MERRPSHHDRYYTPERIAYRLRNWAELCALAETPQTARGLLDRGPTRESPRAGARQKGYHSDQLSWANEKADLESACESLRGAEAEIARQVMMGVHLETYARLIHRRTAEVYMTFRSACRKMASALGWAEE